MEAQASRRPPPPAWPRGKSKTPAVRWFKEWVPQDVASTGGKCLLLKWVTEDMLKNLKEKAVDTKLDECEPEPTTETLYLCSLQNCGKAFRDVGAFKKHSQTHWERQHICTYEGCGKKFPDGSKLKRHYLSHTGEREFKCPYEGCGKAFSLDFNRRTHMKTHVSENYHICPKCGARFLQEHKLHSHMETRHKKEFTDSVKQTPPEKPCSAPITPSSISFFQDRPFACRYGGCNKTYIHEYKLNLHLRKEHPYSFIEENGNQVSASNGISPAESPSCLMKSRKCKADCLEMAAPTKPKPSPHLRRQVSPEGERDEHSCGLEDDGRTFVGSDEDDEDNGEMDNYDDPSSSCLF